jgi:hypothetical protein
MSNPYYSKTGQPASQTQGRSDIIRTEYGLVEAGFDAVYVAMLLRATSASPTFTGTVSAAGATTVTVPTEANVADSSTKAASTAFVQSVLGAAGALLPVQTTYSSLYSLKTDGTVASWTLTHPAQASHSGKFLGTNGTSESWLMVGMARQAAVGTLAIGLADNRTLIDCSGTFTATFAAPATLTTGWHAILRNTGSGNITVAHTSGNIDGLTSYVMYPGEARLFQCDGSTIRSQVIQGFRLFATASTTATMPPGYSRLGFDLLGGGAGGGGGASGTHAGNTQVVNGGCGGGGGGRHVGSIDPPAAGTTITVSVGTGGAAVSGRTAGSSLLSVSGNAGGNSSISWSSVTRAEAQGATLPSAGISYGGEYLVNNYGSRYTGGSQTAQNATNSDGASSYMAAPAGGNGGGVLYNGGGPAYNFQPASAGGTKNTGTLGGGGAAGTSGASGGAGSTAADSGGGGGGYGNAGAGGNGAAGTGYGSGGGGGGACTDGSAAGGNGAAGADGYACIVGLV